MAIAQAGGIEFEWIKEFDLGALKAPGMSPFGQVPYIEHGDVKLGQGWACFRYVAKLGGLLGDTDAEYALSEMLIEEAVDIFNLMGTANYATDKPAAWTALFEDGGKMKAQLQMLENLLPGGASPFFKAGEKRLAGGIAIASVVDIAINMDAPLKDWMAASTPKLAAFMSAMMESPAFAGISSLTPYFTRA